MVACQECIGFYFVRRRDFYHSVRSRSNGDISAVSINGSGNIYLWSIKVDFESPLFPISGINGIVVLRIQFYHTRFDEYSFTIVFREIMTAYGRAGIMNFPSPKWICNILRFNRDDAVIPAFDINSVPIIHQAESFSGGDIEIFKSINICFTVTFCIYTVIISSNTDSIGDSDICFVTTITIDALI